jgi:hypothetical protein
MERRIEASTRVPVRFADAARTLQHQRLGELLGVQAADGSRHPRLLPTCLEDDGLAPLVAIDIGEICRVGDVVRVTTSIVPVDDLWLLGPVNGVLELRPDGDGSLLSLRGTYPFVLPSTARFGDGVLVHRLVRRSLTLLLEQLGTAMQVRTRASQRVRSSGGMEARR